MANTSDTKLIFQGLPVEMTYRICQFLPLHDLCTVRLLWRHFTGVAILELSVMLKDKLESIQALMTSTGLMTLRGITRVKSFRYRIKEVAIMSAILHVLSYIKRIRTGIKFEKFTADQHIFERSETAQQLLEDIFRNLTDAVDEVETEKEKLIEYTGDVPGLRAIKIEFSISVSNSRNAFGMRHLFKELNTDGDEEEIMKY